MQHQVVAQLLIEFAFLAPPGLLPHLLQDPDDHYTRPSGRCSASVLLRSLHAYTSLYRQ